MSDVHGRVWPSWQHGAAPLLAGIGLSRLSTELLSLALLGGLFLHLLGRIHKAVRGWWVRTREFRHQAILLRVFGRWCGWLNPQRCLYYCALTRLGIVLFPGWHVTAIPFLLYARNATVGWVLVEFGPRLLRQAWLVLFPAVFLMLLYAEHRGLLPHFHAAWLFFRPDSVGTTVSATAIDLGNWIGCPKDTNPCRVCDPRPHQAPPGRFISALLHSVGTDLVSWYPETSKTLDAYGVSSTVKTVVGTTVVAGATAYAVKGWAGGCRTLYRGAQMVCTPVVNSQEYIRIMYGTTGLAAAPHKVSLAPKVVPLPVADDTVEPPAKDIHPRPAPQVGAGIPSGQSARWQAAIKSEMAASPGLKDFIGRDVTESLHLLSHDAEAVAKSTDSAKAPKK